jgi:hypothetical protein
MITNSAPPSLGDLAAQARDAWTQFWNRYKAQTKSPNAVWKRVTFSGTVSAAQAGLNPATAYFPFDIRPQTGRLWSARKLAIYAGTAGPFAATLANVTAAVFNTGVPVSSAGQPLPAMDAEVPGLTIPTAQLFGAHMITVRGSNQWLVIGIQGTGVVSGLQVFGHAEVLEIDDDPDLLLSL